jgi:LysM repeat protein
LNRLPMIYTTASFWNSHLTDQFGAYPLWIAEYGVQAPKIPEGWSGWQFWQYSQSGAVQGVAGSVDMDTFDGSYQDLLDFILSTQPQSDSKASASEGTGSDASANDQTNEAVNKQAASESQQSATTYTIKSGDTLGGIAAHFGVSVTELAEANDISDPNEIDVGQVLTIP